VTDATDPGRDVRQTGLVAAGTLLSRVTGFVRTVMVLAALGAGLVGDAYNAANVLPNAVYDLLLGGVLSGPPLAVVLRAHGHVSAASARYTGWVLAAFAVGLVPFAVFQIQTRALYALHDARSPALVNAVATGVNIALDLLLVAVLPADRQVAALALGFSASYLIAAIGTTLALRSHLGLLDGRRILNTHLRLLAAGLAAGLAATLASALTASGVPGVGGICLGVGALAGMAIFLLACQWLRIEEVAALRQLIRRRP
jgi:putative peptidoglycan lipid II flippase